MFRIKLSENSHRARIIFNLFILLGIFIFPVITFASTTDGTIIKATSSDGYAWGENAGWINFSVSSLSSTSTPPQNVHVTATALSGYLWDSVFGWVNLSPASSSVAGVGVKNDGQGNLSGYAWSPNAGWINFGGVIINSSGKFTGMAIGSNTYGRINFSCTRCNVVTDWRPVAITTPTSPSVGSISIFIKPPTVPGPAIVPEVPTPIPTSIIKTPAPSEQKEGVPGIQVPSAGGEIPSATQPSGQEQPTVISATTTEVKKPAAESNLNIVVSIIKKSVKQAYKQTTTFTKKAFTKTKEVMFTFWGNFTTKSMTFWEWLLKIFHLRK